MGETVIRVAGKPDADGVFALLEQFATTYRPERGAFDRHYPLLLADQAVYLIVAAIGDQVVAYALAFRLLTLFANGPVVELQELMVAPAFRKRGIGRRLVENIVERAEHDGALEVTVPTRRAAGYYVALGFEEIATYLKRTVAR